MARRYRGGRRRKVYRIVRRARRRPIRLLASNRAYNKAGGTKTFIIRVTESMTGYSMLWNQADTPVRTAECVFNVNNVLTASGTNP